MDLMQLLFSLLFSVLPIDCGPTCMRVQAAADQALQNVVRLVPGPSPEHRRMPPRVRPCETRLPELPRA